jgi:hypothetical protein
MGDDAKTTYEHIGQFLAQVNNVGITDVHKIRMFLLSLTRATFNWLTSLPPNSIDSWVSLCHTPFRDSGNEASIRVPRMFHSHV